MSLDFALSRITQIVAWQQGVMDPSAGTAASASTATLPTTTSSAATAFSDALASAQGAIGTTSGTTLGSTGLGSTGLTGLTGLAGTTLGATVPSAAGPASAQIGAMQTMANSLIGKPYIFGGGHADWSPQPGYDCSGFVSAVLHAGGYLSQPADTTSLPTQPGIASGPGQYVTIYDRAQPGEHGHVIIEINGQFYESGGEAGPWGGGGGVAKIGQPTAAYLATFPNVLHPQGL
jgi:cell wall-associated NlpC family hydrolase